MGLLTHIHHILNLWEDDETHSCDICRLWGMIQEHVLLGPITGVPLAFTNPKQSLFPDMTLLFYQPVPKPLWVVREEYIHIHLNYLVNLLIFVIKTREIKNKDEKEGETTPRSVIPETKSDNLDISLRQNASRLFSQVKNKRDRQEEEEEEKQK